MDICSKRHPEIVHDEGYRDCPICNKISEMTLLEDQIVDLEKEKDNLEDKIFNLEEKEGKSDGEK